jgi:hypothetical protein
VKRYGRSIPRRAFFERFTGMSGLFVLPAMLRRKRNGAEIGPDRIRRETDHWESIRRIAQRYGGELGGIPPESSTDF